ncbi:MAG: glycosyltransferase [Phycisphaerales bacterium]|nr:glycosyltransferase [Phycisphaerales bacterium]
MTEKSIWVSIIIPLYNKEPYFERCFNSVVKQTYRNIECIIVEDCSTDHSLELANRLVDNYKGDIKFSIIRHEQNSGVSAARNTGIDNSNFEHICFLDSDDEMTGNCIDSLVRLAQKYPGVDIVQGNVYQYPRIDKDPYELKGKLPEFVKGNLEIKKQYSAILPVPSWSKLIRKKFIKRNLYFKERLCHEDYHWHFFMLKKIESLAFTDDYCYIRYFVPDSTMTNPNLTFSISTYLMISEDMLCNLDADLLDQQFEVIFSLLRQQKHRILSDAKYAHFLPKYHELMEKIPKRNLIQLRLKEMKAKIKARIKAQVKRLRLFHTPVRS